MNNVEDLESPNSPIIADGVQAAYRRPTLVSFRRLLFSAVSLGLLVFLLVDTPREQTEAAGLGSQANLVDQKCTPYSGRPATQYALMIDAGSTGSRVHVYRFNYCSGPSPVLEDEVFREVKPGLSSFKGNPFDAANSVKELLEVAMATIPASHRSCTPVALKATAGLRLLGETDSQELLRAVEEMIRKYPFKLPAKDGVVVMDGSDEGI